MTDLDMHFFASVSGQDVKTLHSLTDSYTLAGFLLDRCDTVGIFVLGGKSLHLEHLTLDETDLDEFNDLRSEDEYRDFIVSLAHLDAQELLLILAFLESWANGEQTCYFNYDQERTMDNDD